MAAMAPIPGLRDPADFDTTRRDVYASVLDGVRTKYPLENDTHRLELTDVDYDGPETVPLKEQKQALLKRKSLYRPIKGTWRLIDKATNAVLDQKRTTVVHVPMLTQRGTYILNGSEYSVAHQMRLRPGVYVRRKENGEHEAHFNVVKGGPSFRLLLEPKTGLFRLNIGQGSVPAYPVLKEAGVADDVIRQALGDDLYKVNASKRVTESQINKAWARLVGERAAKETGATGIKRNFREAFEKMEMDPEVTGFTLGEPATKVAPETILKAASKLLKVSRGEAETDDRDSLAYQETLGPDDLLRERIIKDSGRVGARLLWRSTLRKNLAGIPGGALDPQMKAVFFGSGLGSTLEEINPLDALDQAYRVTRMGEGGLSGTSTIPDDARAVQPSQFLFIDPIRSTESTHIGVDLRLARNTRKGSDRAMYTKLRDAKTGEEVWLPPQVMTRATIALPGARRYAEKDGQKRVAAIRGGKLVYVDPDKLDFEASNQADMFNPLSNLLPAAGSMKGGRVMMASKWFIQAMPLKEREAPLVQVDSGDGTSAELQMGSRVGAVRATKGGVVEKLTPDEVVIRHTDGTTSTQDLYNNFLFNRKSHIHNTPQVREGDVVTPGQLLATSNYTDSQGGLAMGRNLRLGYMAHKDSVYEDAVLLSEAAANKLATERLYTEKADFDNMTETGTNKYISLFPATYTRSQLDKLDDSGVVRPWTILEKGDPIMLAVRQRTPKGAGMLYRGSKSRWTDASRTWDHDFQGEVTDTWQDDDGMKVAIKAYAPVEAGDKVVIRHGSKGVVSRVLPDGQMPVAPDGRPLEVILNPQGLVTRSNPSQVIEALLGKVAERRGKPYVLPQEYDGDRLQYALDELKKDGVPETDDLYDPMTGRQIKGVTTGLSYFMALHHQAESKESGRGTGSYTAEGMPTSGEDDENPKRIGSGEMSALVAHGAPAVIREVKTVRGQRNDDYWNAIAMGYPPPAPGVPQIYNKFMDSLKAAGINIRDSNGRLHLAAMTDSDVDKLAAGEITEPATIKWLANFERGAYGEASPEPVPGGLFDRGITGGHGGNRFGFIRLPEPMPSPAFETQIKRILGMTTSKFENVLAGREEIEGIGTGPQSMLEALRRIKPDEELDRLKGQYRVTSSATARDELLKRMRALDGVAAQGIKPADLMITKVPVLPPVFRPVNVNSKFSAIASPNVLYMDLLNANKNFKELQTQVTGEPVSDARMAVYGSLKAVIGMGDPIKPSRKKQNVRGILDEVFGAAGPKTSLVQRSLIGGTTDLAGRGVITPDPNLDMDHIGVPENMAWPMFGRYAVRTLARQMGDSPDSRMKAVKLVADRDPRAKQALLDVMKDHPVMASRAPVLHKFGIMGFEPVLVPGKTIRLSPSVTEVYGADFDGDTMNVHAVVTSDAAKEVRERMFPSRNFRSPADFGPLFTPRHEFLYGLYAASSRRRTDKVPTAFKRASDAIAAFKRGELDIDDEVEIVE